MATDFRRSLYDIEQMCDHLHDPPDPDPELDGMSAADKAWVALQNALCEVHDAVGLETLHAVLCAVTEAYDGANHPANCGDWNGYDAAERVWRIRAWKLGAMAKKGDEGR